MTIINATTSTGGLLGGDPWSPQGIGDGVTEGLYNVVNQTFTITEAAQTTRVWFSGSFSGSSAGSLVYSAYITQGEKSAPVKVNGHTGFFVPPEGRWSDNVSIADFTTPGDVVFIINYVLPTNVPTYSNEPVPDTPVPVSAIQSIVDEIGIVYKTKTGVTILSFAGDSLDDWVVTGDSGEASISDGFMLSCDAYENVIVTRTYNVLDIYPLASFPLVAFDFQFTTNITSSSSGSSVMLLLYSLNTRSYYGGILTLQIYKNNATYPNGLVAITVHNSGATHVDTYSPGIPTGVDLVWRIVMGFGTDGVWSMNVYLNDVLFHSDTETTEFPSEPSYSRHFGDLPYAIQLFAQGAPNIIAHVKNIVFTGYPLIANPLTEVTQSGDITINTNPSPGETFTVSNSATTVFTFVDHYPLNATQIQIAATTALTAQALATAINNISGAEFVATVDGSAISVDAYCESAFAMTSTGIEISSITEIVPGLTTETVTAADSFTATEGGKSVQENATAADSADGLIDGLTEAASVTTVFDTLNDEMDEGISATALSDNFDGLIDYMGEEI
jgi:hypothetical protein